MKDLLLLLLPLVLYYILSTIKVRLCQVEEMSKGICHHITIPPFQPAPGLPGANS